MLSQGSSVSMEDDWKFVNYQRKWTRRLSFIIVSRPTLTLASHDSLSVATWQHAGIAIETGLLHWKNKIMEQWKVSKYKCLKYNTQNSQFCARFEVISACCWSFKCCGMLLHVNRWTVTNILRALCSLGITISKLTMLSQKKCIFSFFPSAAQHCFCF